MTTVGLIEIDVGDTPTFTVKVDPFGGDTAMTAEIKDPAGASTPFAMTGSADLSTWTGTGPTLTTPGEYTAAFTITGTGAGIQHHTVIVAQAPPLSPDLRRLRLLLADTDPTNRIFRVDELADLMVLGGDNVRLAAAQGLDIMARSEVMISKVIKTQDLATDGAKVAAELRASAAELRRQVDESEGDSGGGLDIVDFADPFTRSTGELAENEVI